MDNSGDSGNTELKTKVTYDPGWNDPPLFSYDSVSATAQSKTPKRGALNKRVAFPLSSEPSTNASSSTNTVLPPLPLNSSISATVPNLPPVAGLPTTLNSNIDKNDLNLENEETLQKVTQDLEVILKAGTEELKKNEAEIRRRLDVMKKMWKEKRLKPEICAKMVQLTEALKNGNGELADHVHMGLMIDHVSLCSPWMAGVRQLIHHVKSHTIDKSSEETKST